MITGVLLLSAVTHVALGAAPVVENVDHTSSALSTASLSFPHDIVGPGRLLLVEVVIQANTTVLSVDCGGTALTLIANHFCSGNGCNASSWSLADPPSGPQTITVKLNTAAPVAVAAISLTNVDLTAPLGANNHTSANQSAGMISVNVAATANDLLIDVLGLDASNASWTVGAGQTTVWSDPPGFGSSAPGTKGNMSESFSGARAAIVAVAVQGSVSDGGTSGSDAGSPDGGTQADGGDGGISAGTDGGPEPDAGAVVGDGGVSAGTDGGAPDDGGVTPEELIRKDYVIGCGCDGTSGGLFALVLLTGLVAATRRARRR